MITCVREKHVFEKRFNLTVPILRDIPCNFVACNKQTICCSARDTFLLRLNCKIIAFISILEY